MNTIISRLEAIEKLSKDNKSHLNEFNELRNIYYRLERMEKYLEDNFEYIILKNTPKHYTHRNMKVKILSIKDYINTKEYIGK